MNLKMRSLLSNEFCPEIVGQWTQMLKAIFPFCHPKCRILPKRSTGPVDDFLQKNRWSADFFLKPKALKPGNIECHPFSRGIKLDANVAKVILRDFFFWRVHSFGFVIFLEDGEPPRYRIRDFRSQTAINEAIKLGPTTITKPPSATLWLTSSRNFCGSSNFQWTSGGEDYAYYALCVQAASIQVSGTRVFLRSLFGGKKGGRVLWT